MDEDKSICVYNNTLRKCIEAIPEGTLERTEESLRNELSPSAKMYQVKRHFWQEFLRAQDTGREMVMAKIYKGVVRKTYFYDGIIKNPVKLAWVLHPITKHEDKAQALLDKAYNRYEELLDMEITTTKTVGRGKDAKTITETDPRKAAVLLAAIRDAQDRVLGTAIQRQVGITANQPSSDKKPILDMKAINERLSDLNKKLGMGGDGQEQSDSVVQQIDGDSGTENRRPPKEIDHMAGDVQAGWKSNDGREECSGTIEVKPEDIRHVENEHEDSER